MTVDKDNDLDKPFLQLDKLQNVVIDSTDAKSIIEFFEYFNAPVPDYLSNAVENFDKCQDVDNQNLLRIALCRAFIEGTHDLFQDPLMQAILPNFKKLFFHHQFDEQVSEHCSTQVT